MAIPLFEQALELDPNYSGAYGALAQIYWDYSNNEKFNTVVDPPVGASYPQSGYQTHLNAWKFLQNLKRQYPIHSFGWHMQRLPHPHFVSAPAF